MADQTHAHAHAVCAFCGEVATAGNDVRVDRCSNHTNVAMSIAALRGTARELATQWKPTPPEKDWFGLVLAVKRAAIKFVHYESAESRAALQDAVRRVEEA